MGSEKGDEWGICKLGFWRREESKDCLVSCMQMTWFCMVNHDGAFCWCIGKDV